MKINDKSGSSTDLHNQICIVSCVSHIRWPSIQTPSIRVSLPATNVNHMLTQEEQMLRLLGTEDHEAAARLRTGRPDKLDVLGWDEKSNTLLVLRSLYIW